MATAEECRQRIAAVDEWSGVQALWQRIEQQDTPGWDPGKAFEYLVLRAFELDGAEVRYPFQVQLFDEGSAVEQIDGAIHLPGLSCLMECKDEREPTSFEPIAKMRNQLLRRPSGVVGVVFSRIGFTRPAIRLAHFCAPQSILLWDGAEFGYAISHASRRLVPRLLSKYRRYVELGKPDHDTRPEDQP